MTTKPLAFIIEDDPALNEITCVTLEPYFKIQTYLRGDHAMAALQKEAPALLVLDINLPKISGEEILKKIHESGRFSATKVILTTADSLQAAMLEDQADIVLLKPISTKQLRELAIRMTA